MMASQIHVNPRFRAYGKARLDIARRAQTREEWETLWKPAMYNFPFAWGRHWKQCIEYRVEDYAAEVGFFIDVMGFPVNAFDPDYAQFTSPDGEFFIAVVPVYGDQPSTPPEAITLQFLISNLEATVQELEKRGVSFERPPGPLQPGSRMQLAAFRTPHGIMIELWGELVPVLRSPDIQKPPKFSETHGSSDRQLTSSPGEDRPKPITEQSNRVTGWVPPEKKGLNNYPSGNRRTATQSQPPRSQTFPTTTMPDSSRVKTNQPAPKVPGFFPAPGPAKEQDPLEPKTTASGEISKNAGADKRVTDPQSAGRNPLPKDPEISAGEQNYQLRQQDGGGEPDSEYNTPSSNKTLNVAEKKKTYKVAEQRPLLRK